MNTLSFFKLRMCMLLGSICMPVGGLCQTTETNSPIDFLRNAPAILGNSFRCDQMVLAVNSLRRVGKAHALTVLKEHLRQFQETGEPRQQQKLLLVCRLLFINPKGWAPPKLGQPFPEVDWQVAKEFPLFPLAVSHEVPFLLLRGYGSGGFTSDTPARCLEICATFPIRETDLSETGYVEAAKALVGTSALQNLYSDLSSRSIAVEMILEQAESSGDKLQKEN